MSSEGRQCDDTIADTVTNTTSTDSQSLGQLASTAAARATQFFESRGIVALDVPKVCKMNVN